MSGPRYTRTLQGVGPATVRITAELENDGSPEADLYLRVMAPGGMDRDTLRVPEPCSECPACALARRAARIDYLIFGGAVALLLALVAVLYATGALPR